MKVKLWCFFFDLWLLGNEKKKITQKQKELKRRTYDPKIYHEDHGLPDFDSIGPKINTNNPSKKLTREEHERILQGISHWNGVFNWL